ncbi:pyridoxamine 5'-phosphate oxidase family protein [Zoogloea sp.]|uniref:HugZ family pyridoxamine 5'-phosphate oxidase n=1 Tax=Zoogloea sp. TaxID=49181 RepID=UPI00258B34CB|nr:pyridoxamine 5'-phosphate oxidase family protein [Zoogloea sp.]MBT9498464.1 pyridoxamine 5'-phosphate oxidase family protein [Zoogloea sp.]MDD2667217.1 pyridoxamine 5'-phosphate oxidase family protein [Zoogloea sp.]
MRVDYAEARKLLRRSRSGALGTHSVAAPGYPFVTLLPYVADEACRPVFLLSGLAEHTRNILADARASLLVADGEGGLLQQARVTLIGLVTPVVLDEAALGRYLRYSPESADYLALGDFRFFRMEPERVRYIGGFARMGWADASVPAQTLDSTAEAALVVDLARQAPVGVSVLGVDFEGLNVRICGVFRRFDLHPVNPTLAALGEAAEALLGHMGDFTPTSGNPNLG